MKITKLLKKNIFFGILVILIMIVISIILKYDVEGEKTLPYSISRMLLVSTVDGERIDDIENIWNIKISQINDLYIYIDNTSNTKETIKQITIENFSIKKRPNKGEVKILRPTGDLDKLYTYSEQNYLNDKITYAGSEVNDLKLLEISNNGGIVGFRIELENIDSYISNSETEIIYDGSLLSNLGITIEEIKLDLSFDIIIETSEKINYKGTVNVSTPINTIIEQGSANAEITDFEDVVFKRI